MIPVQLTLKNFLSYRNVTLDFSGLHIACICGSNGAGKSSLLEAMTWAVWGQSRAAAEDDIIHTGAKEVQVDFIFTSNQQQYRVIRTRHRGQSSSLEFQMATPNGFRALTERGVRATQQLILEHIKLDYDTFINSAYLRQGRADEFMLKRPTERKEILAELLKLNQYDDLEERAKDLSRSLKGKAEELERTLAGMQHQLQQKEAISLERAHLEAQHNQLQQQQAFDTIQLQSLQVVQHQRQTWEQQLGFLQQQYQNLTQDSDRLAEERRAINEQLSAIEEILSHTDEIHAGYAKYESLQIEEENLSAKFQEHSRTTVQLQHLQQQLTQQVNEIRSALQHAEAQFAALQQQEQEIQHTLHKSAEVETGLAQLTTARNRLAHLDHLQLQVTPLLQYRTTIQTQLERVQARIQARLEELQTSEHQLTHQQQRQPQLQQAVMNVAIQLEQLEKKRVYLERVREKGQERRHFMERLQAHQRDYEKQMGELEQKLQMLQNPDATCPLCDRPLTEHHWQKVVEKTQTEQQEIQQQFWVIREQMAVSDREIQVLRQEYREISQELSGYDALREQRGQLAAQLEATDDVQRRLQQIVSEKQQLERSLAQNDYALDKQAELQQIEQQLQQLNYNEQDHALARSEIERWRWAEIRQGQLKDAQKRLSQILQRQPQIQAQIAQLNQKIVEQQTCSECARQIAELEERIKTINYAPEQHNATRGALRQAQTWQVRYQQLKNAQEQYPQFQARSQDLKEAIQSRSAERQVLIAQIESLTQQLEQTPLPIVEIQALEEQLALRRRQLDDQLSHLGQLQQQFHQLEAIQAQYQQGQQQLQATKQQQRVYQELAQAFGKNGIQALMIENVLPQLEAETNQLLARLSANQLHVQFVTQKAGRSGTRKKATKMIDTLDILIADARGTRPYETYSGGEAFRINFAIRLALAKLLAQRAGAALQLLIIDEGFGTQDQEGCDRLIAAINAIANDFACILTVTHMPYFKEAFQARIEVAKTQNGSRLSLAI
jgi:exonuclease SbcC